MRFRTLVGDVAGLALYGAGLALLEVGCRLSPALDRAGTAPRGAVEEPDEILGVSLSAEAERMIEEGRAERARPMPAAAAPLAGSAAARARAR